METKAIPGILPGEAKRTRISRRADGCGARDQDAPGSVSGVAGASARWEMEFVNPLEGDAWDRLASGHPGRSVFHTSAWARILNATYGHNPLYLRIIRDGETAALVPLMEVRSPLTGRRGVCVPFSDFAEPLFFNNPAAGPVFRLLAGLAQERNWKHLEIRGSQSARPDLVEPALTFYGHRLDLRDGLDAVQARFSSSVRRAIGKAQRSDLEVKVSRSSEAMNCYFDLHAVTRRRHGLPPQPRSFFENIHRELIQPGAGFVVLAESAARPVAGAVFLRCGDSAVYKFGASDETRWECRPNNLVMCEGIRRLVRDGAKTLHFGRTATENHGLRRFKLAWGAEEERIDYVRFDTSVRAWNSVLIRPTGFYKTLFGIMPLVLNRIAGSVIYPHLD